MIEKKNILISLPIVWSIRNVFYSGLYEKLAKSYNVFFLVPEEGTRLLVSELKIDIKYIIEYPKIKSILLLSILNEVLQIKFENNIPVSNKFFKKWHKEKKQSNREKVKKIGAKFLHQILSDDNIISLKNLILKRILTNQFIQRIQNLKLQFILSTAHVTPYESNLLPFLKHLKIPLYSHILSFDNILSRGFIPVKHFDKIMVWNFQMKQELINYYKIESNKIFLTGTPQFDLNTSENNFRVFEKFPISKEDKYILYCANHFIHTPNEPAFLKHLMQRVSEDKVLKHLKFIIRLHPLDNYNRWDWLKKESPNCFINIPWKKINTTSEDWQIPGKEEFLLLGELIAASSLVMNVGSTTTLDAISLDKPVICIGFNTIDNIESNYYYNVHFSEHFYRLTESGAFDLATTMEDLISKMKSNLLNPNQKHLQRIKVKENIIGQNETNSIDRILQVITQ